MRKSLMFAAGLAAVLCLAAAQAWAGAGDANVPAAMPASAAPADLPKPGESATQPATQPARPKGATITGRVLDKPGGKVVEAVTVTLVGVKGAVATAVTDKDGKYVFDDVAPIGMCHRLRLSGHAAGIWREDVRLSVPRTAPGTEPKTITAIDLYTQTPCTISGMVIDADTGKGVADVEILFSTADQDRDHVRTDKDGKYRLDVIPREVRIYCDGTRDRYLPPEKDPGRTITVKAGDVVKDVNFIVRSAPKFTGRVLMPDGKPAPGVSVLAEVRWSHDTVQDAKRIAEARARREARIKAGTEAPPAQAGEAARKARAGSRESDSGGIGMDFRLKTDSRGRFVGYLRRPENGGNDRDDAIDIVFIARTGGKERGAMKVVRTTTIDPPPEPVEVKLAQAAAAVLEVRDPDGKPLADAKPGVHSWLFDYINIGYDIPQVAPDFANLGGGRYRASGLVPQWDYRLRATADGYKCRTELKVVAKPGETVNAGMLMLDWWGPKAVPGLVAKLKHSDRYAREGACRELAELGRDAGPAVPALIAALNDDQHNTVRFSAAEALGKIGPAASPAVPDLIRALEQDRLGVPREAATALGLIGDPSAIDALKAALAHGDQDAREAAAGALDNPAFISADANIPALLKLARSRKGYQGANLVMLALGPQADLRIARMVQELAGGQDASLTTRHILGILIGRLYENDTEGNVTPKTVLAWWWTFPLDDRVPPNAKLDQAAMAKLWSRLSGDDIVEGYRATLAMAAGGDDVAAFLAGKLKPPAAGSDEIAAMIAQLGDEKASVRDHATAQLALAGRTAEPALKAALAGKPTAEDRSRIAMLLAAVSLPYPGTPSTRQAALGLRVLEMIGTPPALKVLADLAKGNGEDFLRVLARQRAAARARASQAVGAGTPRIGATPASAPATNVAAA